MSRYLLLIFLCSWSHVVPLSRQCMTGNAYPGHVLSVTRSLMANADVAHLKTYKAEDRNACMNDCCTEKYGSCTIVSFKKNASDANCLHFNCRPVMKCKYLSSSSTDSFSFSSAPLPQPVVPSRHTSRNNSSLSTVAAIVTKVPKVDAPAETTEDRGITKEAVATYSEEQFALKNDNTTIKPRKGVGEMMDSSAENTTRSGIKPRKGVTFEDMEMPSISKSKVKPRKGVVYQPQTASSPTVNELSMHSASSVLTQEHSSTPLLNKTYKDIIANDLVSALEKVFEDDTQDLKPSKSSTVESILKSIEITPTFNPVLQTSIPTFSHTPSTEIATSSDLQSSHAPNYVSSSSVQTPSLHTEFMESTEILNQTLMPSTKIPAIFEHAKLLFHEESAEASTTAEDRAESEKERKYKSSMHLVLSLVFGLLVLFTVMGVVAKRVYDNWMRRHYRRMDFLIDGMYNGYG